MNASEFKEKIQAYYDSSEDIGVAVYAVLKQDGEQGPVKLDIESDALAGLKNLFLNSIKEAVLDREELTILNLSSCDERLDAIYNYDLEIPEELSSLQTVIDEDDLPLMNLRDQQLGQIKALLIEIGNNAGQLVLYKTMAPVNIFGRSSFFLRKSESRLEKLEDEFLRVSAGFQLIKVESELLVIDLSALERNFGFHNVIKNEATKGITSIETAGLIENPDVLRELVDDVKYARKLTKVATSSPVIQKQIPSHSVIAFCRNFPALAGKIRFNEAGDRVLLDTKVSKDLFINLLMDNYLTSELTASHYASVAKDSVDDASED